MTYTYLMLSFRAASNYDNQTCLEDIVLLSDQRISVVEGPVTHITSEQKEASVAIKNITLVEPKKN